MLWLGLWENDDDKKKGFVYLSSLLSALPMPIPYVWSVAWRRGTSQFPILCHGISQHFISMYKLLVGLDSGYSIEHRILDDGWIGSSFPSCLSITTTTTGNGTLMWKACLFRRLGLAYTYLPSNQPCVE